MKSLPFLRSTLSIALARTRFIPFTLLSTAALLTAQPAAAAVMLDFGDLTGNTGVITSPTISGNGTVVGLVDDGSGKKFFSWSTTQGFSQLGAFATTGDISAASNDARYLAGTANFIPGNSNQRAYRWNASTGFTDLGTLGGNSSYSTGISSDGAVVVGESITSSGDTRAFRWEAGTLQDLGTLGGGSRATGVSGNGLVVVGESNSAAFRWDATGGMVNLGTLGDSAEAKAANRDGSVIVGTTDTTTNNSPYDSLHAFRWTQAGGMQDLGTLGGTRSEALDVNADGTVVVGTARQADGFSIAFRWTDATGMVNLGVLSGKNSSTATGVSDDGNTIVGNSGNRVFIWTMPADGPDGPDGIMQDLAYLQTSVIRSAVTVNHLISSQTRRLRDITQQQCLPGAAQTWCLGADANTYTGEANTSGTQTTGQFAAGLRLNEQFSVGANLGVGKADLKVQSAEQEKAFSLGLWAAFQQNSNNLGWGANASVASGDSTNRLERGTGLNDVQRARGEFDLNTTALRVAGNYGLQVGTSLVTPEVALTHVRSQQDGFTERNVAFPLTINSSNSNETYATLAVRSATPVTPKGTLHMSLALDTVLQEDTVPLEASSTVPGLSHFTIDSNLDKRRAVPTASVGYSHAINANSTVGGGVQMATSTYEGQRPVMGVGVQYRYAF